MIIQCRKCGTRYRFEETLIQGEGVWVRCSRCQNISFLENPSGAGSDREETVAETVSRPTDDSSAEAVTGLPSGAGAEKGRYRTIQRVFAYAAALILISGSFLFWLMPQAGKSVLEAVPGGSSIAEYLGIESPRRPMDGGIDFIDVKDNFMKNWLAGDLMVVSGTAVNRNSYPVSKLRVRARLLDQTGQFIGETQAYCGNLLSAEDLSRLTEKEIVGKLSIQAGSDMPNADIAPEGKIPFMIVFTNPPKDAVEFIVETVSVERSAAK